VLERKGWAEAQGPASMALTYESERVKIFLENKTHKNPKYLLPKPFYKAPPAHVSPII